MTAILILIFVVAIALVFVLLALIVLRFRRIGDEQQTTTTQRPQPRPPSQAEPRSRSPWPQTIDRAAQKADRGLRAEKRVAALLDWLPAEDYRSYHELYPTKEGSARLTEVDHVVVSPFGIFVIETKGIFGEVFVDPDAEEWQIVRPQRHDHLRNPLRQNEMHTRAIGAALGYRGRSWVRSVVCFADDATELRGAVPDNVVTYDQLRDHIVGYQTSVLNDQGIDRAIAILDELDARTAELAPLHQRQLEVDSRSIGP